MPRLIVLKEKILRTPRDGGPGVEKAPIPPPGPPSGGVLERLRSFKRLFELHRNQQGTISILSVFAVMILTMLLGMVMNVGRQADGKIRMQNAADAAAYSGAVVVTRGMNTLAFTNHLLCEVFSLTAILREGRDRHAESYVPDVLAAWSKEPGKFAISEFPKFINLGSAIRQKIPREQQLVSAYGQWMAAVSAIQLPIFETILAEELIPQYQWAVLEAFPDIAQAAALEVARLNGTPDYGRGPMYGALWRASGASVGDDSELLDPTLPVVDPVYGAMIDQSRYQATARQQRDQWARHYLNQWNHVMMMFFDRYAKMGQFGALWRGFTCGQLEKLIDEYPNSNLPMVLRWEPEDEADPEHYVQRHFVFFGVVYWRNIPELMPKIYSMPAENDAVAYVEVHVFIPQRHLVFAHILPGGGPEDIAIGGVPGDFPTLPLPGQQGPDPGAPGPGRWTVVRQSVPTDWNIFNQHWTCQLAPATHSTLSTVLQTLPPHLDFGGDGFTTPNLGGLSWEEIEQISPH